MLGLFNPYLWIGAAAVLAITNAYTFWNTWSWRDEVNRDALLVARAEAEDRVRKEERESSARVLAIERTSVERLREQVGLAATSILEAKHALANIPRCPVPRATVRLLQPSSARLPVREDPPATAPSNAASAGAGALPGGEETVEASLLLETCVKNNEKVCIPNKLQVLGLQEYAKLAHEACGRKE